MNNPAYSPGPALSERCAAALADGFEVGITWDHYSVRCQFCGWYSEHNRSDADRFWHSQKVHAFHFCPARKRDV